MQKHSLSCDIDVKGHVKQDYIAVTCIIYQRQES